MESLLNNISVLYRYTQKYLDKYLVDYKIGSGQFIFMLLINENQGMSMQKLCEYGDFDKGTVTKSIQKLVDEDYVIIKNDENDKRMKKLFISAKGNEIINDLYRIRNACSNQLLFGIENSDIESLISIMAANSRVYLEKEHSTIKIAGLQKLSLLDYPEKMACTIFTSGCNFKCPFCHNKDLVFVPEDAVEYDIDEFYQYLDKRSKILNAVCISGGEPTLHKGLLNLISDIKSKGYLVKLDTNGYYPDELATLIDSNMIDYIAMDIKNSKEKYAISVGLDEASFDINKIEKSVELIKNSGIDYEFRTTVVAELHDIEDIKAISYWLLDVPKYSLQYFNESDGVIQKGLHPVSSELMQEFKGILNKYINDVQIKGGNEDV